MGKWQKRQRDDKKRNWERIQVSQWEGGVDIQRNNRNNKHILTTNIYGKMTIERQTSRKILPRKG